MVAASIQSTRPARPRIPVECPACHQTRNLEKSDAQKAHARQSKCRHCHSRAIAPLGWAATKARHGEKAAVRHSRAYRLAHPSKLEQRVQRVLEALGLAYEREWLFETPIHYFLDSSGQAMTGTKVFLVDFKLTDSLYQNICIEVNGDWAHQHHADRDALKVAALAMRGFIPLVLDESEIQRDDLQAFIVDTLGFLTMDWRTA